MTDADPKAEAWREWFHGEYGHRPSRLEMRERLPFNAGYASRDAEVQALQAQLEPCKARKADGHE